MGAFNTVLVSAQCPSCGVQGDVRVQFKYGDRWQYAYRVGDALKWGGNDLGVPGMASVVTDGVAETPCPHCGFDGEWAFYVFIDRDIISRATPADGTYDFVSAGETHLVLKE